MSIQIAATKTAGDRPENGLAYEAALRKVMGLADFERSAHSPEHSSFHLKRIGLLMERLGNPHAEMATIHIAGTKGKGSTAAMITSILAAAGYSIGLYTSPHLHSAVERIREGLRPISQERFAALVEQVWPATQLVSKCGGLGGVTTFEILTAMAFLHFNQINVDFQVVEVGLGGRLDSTNIVCPVICAITSISMDHIATLGNSIQKIAGEKAGIIKPKVPVIVAPQTDKATHVFRKIARERGAPLVEVEKRMSWKKTSSGIDGQSFRLEGLFDQYDLWTPLLGDHQLENAATAIATVETLVELGTPVQKQSIVLGMKEVDWPARMHILSRDGPTIVADGAHNPYSMQRLVSALADHLKFKRVIVVFGALSGHSARDMIMELVKLAPLVLAVRSRHPRSVSSATIAEAATEAGLSVEFRSEDTGEGFRRALDLAGDGDLVLGTGSLSVAAEIIEAVKGIPPEIYPQIKRPKIA